MKEDCTVLLFLLLFHNQIRGTASKGDFSLPFLIFEKLKVPFSSKTYTTTSKVDELEKYTGKSP